MKRMMLRIGEHAFHITTQSVYIENIFQKNYHPFMSVSDIQPDICISIQDGYGVPFVNYNVSINKDMNKISYRRADYLIEVDEEYTRANVYVHNELALKHALMNLYSSFIVYKNWGLLIHSSCVIEDGQAHIFAGQSGAGKSTAAKLSYPRELLSDEASIVKINSDEVLVFNSPFRSELEATHAAQFRPLASIQLLVQALQNKRIEVSKSNSLLTIMDKVFYWAREPEEMSRIFHLLKQLVQKVPVFELHFQKNNTFWELITNDSIHSK